MIRHNQLDNLHRHRVRHKIHDRNRRSLCHLQCNHNKLHFDMKTQTIQDYMWNRHRVQHKIHVQNRLSWCHWIIYQSKLEIDTLNLQNQHYKRNRHLVRYNFLFQNKQMNHLRVFHNTLSIRIELHNIHFDMCNCLVLSTNPFPNIHLSCWKGFQNNIEIHIDYHHRVSCKCMYHLQCNYHACYIHLDLLNLNQNIYY